MSKPLTTLMEAALVDAGTVRWDEPVTQLLPDFALGDADTTRALQLWHMSCACTGMPRQDMEGLFEWRDVTPEARLAAMRTMKPTTKLGETFQYSNLMVAAGGFATAHAFAPELPLARAYAKAMTEKVFAPICMTSTTVDFATVAAGEHARPHALAIDGTARVLPLEIERAVEPIAPAGAVWSTLHDMERYAMVELADGVTPDGTRVVTAANLRERARERVKSGAHDAYGLGLDVEELHGLRVLGHDGGAFGFGTTVRLLPDPRVGIIILTNIRNGNAKQQLPFNEAVTRRIYEALFAAARPGVADRVLAYALAQRTHEPRATSPDRSWATALAGRYHEPALGDVEVRATADGAVFDAGEWSSAIDRVVDADGTARLVLLDPPFAGGAVIVGTGDPPTLIVPDQTTYTFARVR